MAIDRDRVQAATDELLRLFESGSLPEAVARTWIRAQANDRPSAQWSLGNQLLMWLAGTEDARGFRQWEAVGRRVRKGAKAFYILGPVTHWIEILMTAEDGTTGPVRVPRVVGFRAIPVFRLEDTEGEPVVYPDYTPLVRPPLEEVARAWGYTVTYGPGDGQCFGWTNPEAKVIHLMTHEPGTFWHELGHAADARTHILRGGQQPDEEVVAETVAAVLAICFGQDAQRLGYTRRYIEGYAAQAKKTPVAAIMTLLNRIHQALTEIWTTAQGLSADIQEGTA